MKDNFQDLVKMVKKAVKGTKIVDQENKTGVSFFEGKKRLVKVLKVKRGFILEINVKLDNEFENIEGMEKISAAKAYQKHLGTMKYLYKTAENKNLEKIIANAVKNFKEEIKKEKSKENTN